jgi:hypothetical protein
MRREIFLDLANDHRDYKVRLNEAVAKVTTEEKQYIRDAMVGKVHGIQTVGDIARSMNMELMVVATVITNNIEKTELHSLREGAWV